MFKMIPLLILTITIPWAALPAAAQGPESRGLCYSAPDGRGKVIEWAQSKEQCLIYQGRSWGLGGRYENINRESVPSAMSPARTSGLYQCFSGPDAQGQVIRQSTTLDSCRANQGQSWGYRSHFENITPAPQPPDNPIYQQPGAVPQCYFGLNGRGKVIQWAKTKEQCRTQTNGQSWGHSGHYENFHRESSDRWR